ncbi:HlyC/CorC family transporter [Streptomyces sp. NEAU-H3]|nr:hemolysin family protein [Streptomyces sp. NEAU-H3]NJA59286.1 HlyC/CorC family transporter [Streptomyces sp. NEAU-H3]
MSVLQLLLAAVLILANGFFVGAEFALVSVRRSQIEPLAADSARARRVLHGLEHLPKMMAAAQFGITLCSLTLGAVAEPTVAHLLEPLFTAAHLPEGLVHPLGYVIALLLVVFLHLVIGEMVPKNLAMAAPEKAALWFGPGLIAFARVCGPVSDQLSHLVEDAGQAGLLDAEAQERLEDALELGTRPVTDVLLDRSQLVTVDPAVTPRRIEELTVATGYSRFPVLGTGGVFMGYLHVKDVLDLDEPDRAVPQRLWHRMITLRAELPLDDALTVMRRAATHLAQVADASGRVLGLVTLEDALELLVGEVTDPAHRLPEPGRATAPARARVQVEPVTVQRQPRPGEEALTS